MYKLCQRKAFLADKIQWNKDKEVIVRRGKNQTAEIGKISKFRQWNLWEQIRNNYMLVQFLCKLAFVYIFETLRRIFEKSVLKYYFGWSVEKVNSRNQLLLNLMKPRVNVIERDLGIRFHFLSITMIKALYPNFCFWLKIIAKKIFFTRISVFRLNWRGKIFF